MSEGAESQLPDNSESQQSVDDKNHSPLNQYSDSLLAETDEGQSHKQTVSRLAKVRGMLSSFTSSASEALIPKNKKIPIEEITEDKVAKEILTSRPEIMGRGDLPFGLGVLEDQLGWAGKNVPIEERKLLQESLRRHLGNLISNGEVRVIAVHDDEGRFIRRDYQITNKERSKLEARFNDNQQAPN